MIHIETYGRGTDLVLLHGWAMHGGIWSSVVETLAQTFCVHVVDLPGHGYSPLERPFTLDAIVEEVASAFPLPVHVCGWSLGGAVAFEWARRFPDQVKSVVLVASSPCFQQREDWAHAMPATTLKKFTAQLTLDYETTLKQFLALQVLGSESARPILKALQDRLFERGRPDATLLSAGLTLLAETDLRPHVPHLAQPVQLIVGSKDTLTPLGAAHWLAQHLKEVECEVIEAAGHAPFFSHSDRFCSLIEDFLKRKA